MGEQLVPGVPPVPLAPGGADGVPRAVDPTEPARRLLRDLRTDRRGLSGREAARRLEVVGPNELPRRRGERWWRELVRQVSHPLALLLWGAGFLAFAVGTPTLGWAILLRDRAERVVRVCSGTPGGARGPGAAGLPAGAGAGAA